MLLKIHSVRQRGPEIVGYRCSILVRRQLALLDEVLLSTSSDNR